MRALCVGLLPVALVLVGLATACGDDDAGTVPGPDGGSDAARDAGGSDSGHAGHDSGPVPDAGPPPIRCTDEELAANDLTDGGLLEVRFLKAANPRQYENRCATVKVGATVTFTGSFLQHPLEAAGGDSPNPIPYVAKDQPDDKIVVTMPNAGTFGYQCVFHPSMMFGAIRVVP
jgi:plastocyanin